MAVRIVPLLLFLAFLSLGGCDLPRDPEDTTAIVEGRTLKVGVLGTTDLPDEDAEAIRRIAETFSAKVETTHGGPHQLVAMLQNGEIHLLAGGIPASTPFQSHVGLTNPVGLVRIGDRTDDRVLAIRKGENRFLLTVNRSIAPLRPDK